MITREDAERELVGKLDSMSAQSGDRLHEEEEEVVPPPPAADFGGDHASEDSDEPLSASTTTPPLPQMRTFLDELDDDEPLSTISDGDNDPFGFFETLPQAGPSCTKH